MTRWSWIVALLTAFGGDHRAEGKDPAANEMLRQGEYISHHVAMCVVCHSPKDGGGRVVVGQQFQGSPMPVRSPYPDQTWAFRAPALVGGAARGEEDLIKLLMTGKDTTGWSPKPPMPPFRMNLADATAVARYLSSLRE